MPGFVPKGKKIEKAPPELIPKVSAEDVRPKVVITSMFGKTVAPVLATFSKSATTVKQMPKKPTTTLKPVVESTATFNEVADDEYTDTENLVGRLVEPTAKLAIAEPTGDLQEMGDLIKAEERANPYQQKEAPKAYIPETRRGFSEFIKQNYDSFILKTGDDKVPTAAGEKYPYQRFIREYMRQASPYRGILVYHGLGSGKTCTAIATAEALFSTAHKKIIVMTPFSLRKNFLKEVSLCGFRHFRLSNFWVPLEISDATNRLFATSVLGISESYLKTTRNVWVPDFRKGTAEANYSELTADQQTEIRKQILSILVWDQVKNPGGRIRFINYNGISAKKLQEIACKKPYADFFDDAVIVVDEIHNLIRLMQGTIEPYLSRMKGLRRLIPLEEVTPKKWNPALCEGSSKMYARGYLFYRLMLDARNSKIVGLSGTPLINFPEELGILMNVLHGYITTVEMTVDKVGTKAQQECVKVMSDFRYTDFVRASQDPAGGGTRVLCTLLPYGVRKIGQDVGVERIPEGEDIPTLETIVAELQEAMKAADLNVRGAPVVKAVPLLPPTGEVFREKFILSDNSDVNAQNKIVLVKRLTGLISYYKGSNEELMPSIKVDEVVRVPMSSYSQKMYVEARETEIASEKKKKESGIGGVWAEVYDIGEGAQSSNYKMASRQACNFTFPPTVTRPRPRSKVEQMMEARSGNVVGDILDTAPDGAEPRVADEFPELEAEEAADEEAAEAVAAEDAAEEEAAAATEDAQEAPIQAGGQEDDEPPVEDETTTVATVLTKRKTIFRMKAAPTTTAENIALKASQLQGDCKAGQKPGEDYRDAIARAKECLGTLARDQMKLGPEGLSVYAPKFTEMLKRIAAAPGSSLVYSQFLDMEGIGIFKIAMDLNGFSPIEITRSGTGFKFTARTEASLRKKDTFRYITFSGGEEEDIRRLSLDIFNAKLDELPQNLKSVLEEVGYTDNYTGQLCRVFCITSAGAEGISLKCVRTVHVMEPYWNDVRTRQVKGRAIRIGSHLDLPAQDRNVSIYTYLSVFSETAQLAKSGDDRIDETIRQADRVERKDALALGLPIAPKAMDYVLTTDERLFLIADRKKKILNALESVMKASAVDCELNIQENKDGSFQCLPLRGKVGDFLYHPDLNTDITESASQFKVQAPALPTQQANKTLQAPTFIRQEYKGTRYKMKYIRAGPTAPVTGFQMYADDDENMTKLLGTTGVNPKSKAGEERPGPPVKLL